MPQSGGLTSFLDFISQPRFVCFVFSYAGTCLFVAKEARRERMEEKVLARFTWTMGGVERERTERAERGED
jgi:hypothetical protein